MAETPPTTSPLGTAAPYSDAEKARIRRERRERREANIKAGGKSRLDRITGLGGGLQRDNNPESATSNVEPVSHTDPEEVILTEHLYQSTHNPHPRNNNRNGHHPIPDFSLRPSQMSNHASRGILPSLTEPGENRGFNQPEPLRNPFAAIDNPESAPGPVGSDPLMALLQQVLRATGDEPGSVPSFPGLPGMDVPNQRLNEVATTIDTVGCIWRFVHAIFAMGFGMYIVSTAGFIDSMQSGDRYVYDGTDLRAFYTFATVEAILQGTRLIFDRRKVNQNGVMWMFLRFLPEPFGAYLKLLMKYRNIWATTSADVLVLVFVIVAANHWRAS